MKEIVLNELGYFCEKECEAIKEHLQGKTLLDFDISWSKCGAANCILIVRTDEDIEEKEIKDKFMGACLRCIFQLKRGMQ